MEKESTVCLLERGAGESVGGDGNVPLIRGIEVGDLERKASSSSSVGDGEREGTRVWWSNIIYELDVVYDEAVVGRPPA